MPSKQQVKEAFNNPGDTADHGSDQAKKYPDDSSQQANGQAKYTTGYSKAYWYRQKKYKGYHEKGKCFDHIISFQITVQKPF